VKLRIGLGVDTHRLEDGIPLFIGGVKIPFHKGSLGHSDGDVLIHALCDSILGALNLGDLGFYFPSEDESIRGLRSSIILKKINELLQENNASIVNIDSTIILQRPKLKNYISDMKDVICSILHIEKEKLSIKSKTTDHLGLIGQGDAISAMSTVLLEVHRNPS